MVNNLLRCLPVLLPVIVTTGTPANLAFPANRGGEGGFSIPAVLKIRIPIQGVEDADGLLNQALGIEAPAPLLSGRHGLGLPFRLVRGGACVELARRVGDPHNIVNERREHGVQGLRPTELLSVFG